MKLNFEKINGDYYVSSTKLDTATLTIENLKNVEITVGEDIITLKNGIFLDELELELDGEWLYLIRERTPEELEKEKRDKQRIALQVGLVEVLEKQTIDSINVKVALADLTEMILNILEKGGN